MKLMGIPKYIFFSVIAFGWITAAASAENVIYTTPKATYAQLSIENDRIAPEPIPHIKSDDLQPGEVDYFLHNYPAHGQLRTPIVNMRLPAGFATIEGGRQHVFGLHFKVWYPALIEGNKTELGKIPARCNKFGCDETIDIRVENVMGSNYSKNRHLNILLEDMSKAKIDSPLVYSQSKSSMALFDTVYDVKYPKDREYLNEQYYVKLTSDGTVKYFVKCGPNTPVKMCKSFFWLSGHDDIEVSSYFSMSYLDSLEQMQKLLDDLLSSFVRRIITE